jgi:uncharacterized membrane protein
MVLVCDDYNHTYTIEYPHMTHATDRTAEKSLKTEFRVSRVIIAYKFILGLVEFITGAGLVFWGRDAFRWYQAFMLRELTEDPHDVLARLTLRIVPDLLAQHTALAIYLIVLGAAKIAGAVGLVYQQNWGVDLLVSLTVLMLPFQVISLILHPSIPDVVYLVAGLLIALYLVNFKPKAWVSRTFARARGWVEKTLAKHPSTPA